MPLYEYDCEACGARFEVIRKFSDPPLETCTSCGKGPISRLQSSPAFQFKGSGFYITDYPKKAEGGKGEGGKGEKTADTETKADKSEAKTDSAAKGETAAKSDAPAKTDAPAKPSGPSSTPGGGTKA